MKVRQLFFCFLICTYGPPCTKTCSFSTVRDNLLENWKLSESPRVKTCYSEECGGQGANSCAVEKSRITFNSLKT